MPTIDGRKVNLKLTDIIKPGTTKRISGEGLPYPKCPSRRGDIIVEFDIKFPDSLSENTKEILADTLPRS